MDDPGSTVHADNSRVPRSSRAEPGVTERPGDNWCCRDRELAGAVLLTARIGIPDIGKPQPGETVVVSVAAGAVGSVAGEPAIRAPQAISRRHCKGVSRNARQVDCN